jgi:CheY-like chemotaxis protein
MDAAENRADAGPPAADADVTSRILVVEDDPLTRDHVVDLLLELGYSVCSAANALEALKIIEEDPDIALVFTDIAMPGLNGIILADMLHQHRPKLKILYTTGGRGISRFDVEAGVRHGNILKKPYGIDELHNEIRRILA